MGTIISVPIFRLTNPVMPNDFYVISDGSLLELHWRRSFQQRYITELLLIHNTH